MDGGRKDQRREEERKNANEGRKMYTALFTYLITKQLTFLFPGPISFLKQVQKWVLTYILATGRDFWDTDH